MSRDVKRNRLRFGGISAAYRGSASVLRLSGQGVEIQRIKKRRPWLPLWHIMVFIYLILMIRLIVVAQIGPIAYANRVDQMRNGSMLERAAAHVLVLDPLSASGASQLRALMHTLRSYAPEPRGW